MLESWRREEAISRSSAGSRDPVIDTPAQKASKTEAERQKEVERALRLVDAAMKTAEGQLDSITTLPSARLKRKAGPPPQHAPGSGT